MAWASWAAAVVLAAVDGNNNGPVGPVNQVTDNIKLKFLEILNRREFVPEMAAEFFNDGYLVGFGDADEVFERHRQNYRAYLNGLSKLVSDKASLRTEILKAIELYLSASSTCAENDESLNQEKMQCNEPL